MLARGQSGDNKARSSVKQWHGATRAALVVGVVVVAGVLMLLSRGGASGEIRSGAVGSEPAVEAGSAPAAASGGVGSLTTSRRASSASATLAMAAGASAEEMAVHVAGLADDWLYASPEAFERSMRSVFAPDSHDALRTVVLNEGVGLMRTALATAPTQEATWFFTQPLSAAVLVDSGEEAVVQVWDVSVFSREGVSEPTATWTIHDVELVNIDGHWLVSDWQSKPGPVPATHLRHQPSSAEVLTAKLFEHRRVDRANFTLSVSRDQE